MFSLVKIIEYFIIAVALSAFCCLGSFKALAGLQQLGYSGKKYAKWLNKKGNMLLSRLILLAFLCVLSSAVLAISFSFTGFSALISLIPYPLFFGLYFYADKRALKVNLKATARLKLIYLIEYISFIIISGAITIAVNAVSHFANIQLIENFRYLPLAILPLLIPIIVRFSNAVVAVYSNSKNKKYINSAKEKLENSSAVCIGITGSFGKTSVKNILSAMLSKKYKTLATPFSYNTPLGISKFVNQSDLQGVEFFIAEMGARNLGDIQELCSLCKPEHAIITGVCAQHLETFLNLENVKKAKSELLLGVNEGGIAILGESAKDLKIENKGLRYMLFGDEIKAENVQSDCNGLKFDLIINDKKINLCCKLLGEHNAYNIALAAALAYKLGIGESDIISAVEQLDFTPHRLQKIEANGVTILDDSYNSNIQGANSAIDTLLKFGGKKFAVTPGLVELGILEESANFALGEKLALVDRVILVGSTLIEPVKKGYLSANGNVENLTIVPTLKKAQELLAKELTKGDTVLFLNDLPDVY